MVGFLVKIGRRAASYRRGRANDRAFAALDARTLQDIGIDRGRFGRSGSRGARGYGGDRRF
jgi:uncharacterized protein YjiS (DUF1127 family)